MNQRESYRVKAAQFRVRAQTEQNREQRWAMEDLARDYDRLAEGTGTETALTVDVETPPETPSIQ